MGDKYHVHWLLREGRVAQRAQPDGLVSTMAIGIIPKERNGD
jgi:hypothetical protein